MASHEHTDGCAAGSQYVLVRVSLTLERRGTAVARIAMKPGAACWSDLQTVAQEHFQVEGGWYPQSPEEAAEVACLALRQAYPGLF